ncbi:hypothetical protein D6T91_14605 [Salmonella enterica subsp. houtenae]|nr:hypothetical protein [Salmonella enterica]EDO5295728.1 hypothetical protein [Salmonella enterica subsp. houtenae serovar 40:z4,z24:-]ELM1618503.1 hypothetical protein [Salmonella enterica]MCR5947141.1 hypothetical protein [Salmonella enterica subsp. houtenae]
MAVIFYRHLTGRIKNPYAAGIKRKFPKPSEQIVFCAIPKKKIFPDQVIPEFMQYKPLNWQGLQASLHSSAQKNF